MTSLNFDKGLKSHMQNDNAHFELGDLVTWTQWRNGHVVNYLGVVTKEMTTIPGIQEVYVNFMTDNFMGWFLSSSLRKFAAGDTNE